MKKKLLSISLMLCMVLPIVPATASAATPLPYIGGDVSNCKMTKAQAEAYIKCLSQVPKPDYWVSDEDNVAALIDINGDGLPILATIVDAHAGLSSEVYLFDINGKMLDIEPYIGTLSALTWKGNNCLYIDINKTTSAPSSRTILIYQIKDGNTTIIDQFEEEISDTYTIGDERDGWSAQVWDGRNYVILDGNNSSEEWLRFTKQLSPLDNGTFLFRYTVNGRPVDEDTYYASLETIPAIENPFVDWGVNSSFPFIPLTACSAALSTYAATAPLTATPTSSAIIVDGQQVSPAAYTIEQNNYFKLRDLAVLLSGTAAQFDIGWDGANNQITLTTGTPYTPVGGELAAGSIGSQFARPNAATVLLDGKPVDLAAYTIHGNNFFKLRDIGNVLGFSVTWDGAANKIIVDTQ